MSGILFLLIDRRLFVAWTLALAVSGVGADETGVREATFSLYAPQAKSVEIIGDFNQWQSGTQPLSGPDETGRWQTRLTVSGAWGRIEYVYWVDNTHRQVDPDQPVVPDGFSGQNNVLVLP
ncbi:MAG: glycogen-binding domain-containing protein [Thiobacillus sp.]|nr:glycogen-binding domain-containing protein [Thiobacillus sp.]